MTQSATAPQGRAHHRQVTAYKISRAAQQLTEEHGLDGFTLDQLATAAGVSRRTLFNYYPSKLDAVLGQVPDIDDDVVARFVAGGPHQDLVEDLIELARLLVDSTGLSREDLELARRVLLSEPRLVERVHERFDGLCTDFGALILRREGADFGQDRARLMIRVLVCVYDIALDRALTDPGSLASFSDVLSECIRDVRRLFG